jgi:hypothetical protein
MVKECQIDKTLPCTVWADVKLTPYNKTITNFISFTLVPSELRISRPFAR